MNISYINMCKLKKNRERRKELEREGLVVMVCVVVHLVKQIFVVAWCDNFIQMSTHN